MNLQPGIMFVTRKWAPATGGMETYCMKLTEKLAEHGQVEVVALPGKSDGMPPGPLALLGFPLTVFAHYLRRRQTPTVLHLGDMAIWPLALPALLWRGTKIVFSAHGTDVAYPRRGGIKGRLYGLYLRLGAKLLAQALVIANSQATQRVTRETGWQNITIVRLGTDLRPSDSNIVHGNTILFAGRLVERKGFGWFVREVLPLLPADISVNVAGNGWDDAERAALDHPLVTHLGNLNQAQLARAYAEALCVIVPNIELPNGEFEGFGLVAVEAASAGGVVLAADHGGLRDAVIDGETGFLVASGAPQAWAAKIGEIADWDAQARNAFVGGSTASVRKFFNWDRVACETLAVYRQP